MVGNLHNTNFEHDSGEVKLKVAIIEDTANRGYLGRKAKSTDGGRCAHRMCSFQLQFIHYPYYIELIIVEEHYERYMDQEEEEFEREHGESISDSDCVYSDSDSDHDFVG